MPTTVRAALLALLAACAPEVLTNVVDARAMTGDGPPSVDGAPQVGNRRFRGLLAATATVPFGGDPYCNYQVTLRDVELDVTLHPSALTTMTVKNAMVEETVGDCPFGPAPPSTQVFEHRGSARPVLGDGTFQPALEGLATNHPATLTTAIVTADAGTFTASVMWERTDQGPPLKWIVMTAAAIQLSPVTCVADGIYCLGGSVEGALYRCTDGLDLTEVKQCTAGCAPPSTVEPHRDETCN